MRGKTVSIDRSVIQSIRDYAKGCHPKEGILLLKGKVRKDRIIVEEVEVPPLAVHGRGFSDFQPYRLPIDFSIIGTVHTHPSGVLRPSVADLNNFYGRIMMIAAYPYSSGHNIAVFDANGSQIDYERTQ